MHIDPSFKFLMIGFVPSSWQLNSVEWTWKPRWKSSEQEEIASNEEASKGFPEKTEFGLNLGGALGLEITEAKSQEGHWEVWAIWPRFSITVKQVAFYIVEQDYTKFTDEGGPWGEV